MGDGGQPGRFDIIARVVGQPGRAGSIGIHDVDLRVPVSTVDSGDRTRPKYRVRRIRSFVATTDGRRLENQAIR